MSSKKEIVPEKFIELMLEPMGELKAMLLQAIDEDFDYQKGGRGLDFEVTIFCLWILTISLPPSDRIRDMLHDQFSKKKVKVEMKEDFYRELDKRYKNYFEAFNIWKKNPQNGMLIGTVIYEIIINQNPNFSLKNNIPMNVGLMESMKASLLLKLAFNFTMGIVKGIKEQYEINNLKNL